MRYLNWMNEKVKKLDWLDISMVKLSAAAFVLAAAKLWPPLISLEWYWYAALFVVAAIRPFCRMHLFD